MSHQKIFGNLTDVSVYCQTSLGRNKKVFTKLVEKKGTSRTVRHNVKTVGKNEREVIVDRVVRERNPELDKLMEYLSSMSEMMKTEEDMTVKNNLCLNCMKEIIQHHEGKAHNDSYESYFIPFGFYRGSALEPCY